MTVTLPRLFPKRPSSNELAKLPHDTVLYNPQISVCGITGQCSVKIAEYRVRNNPRKYAGARPRVLHWFSEAHGEWKPSMVGIKGALYQSFDESVNDTQAALTKLKVNVNALTI